MITSNVSKLALRRGSKCSRVCVRRTCEIVCSVYLWERNVRALRIGSYLLTSKMMWSTHIFSRFVYIVQIRELLFSIIISHSSIDIALILVSNWHWRLQDTKWVLHAANIVESDELLLALLPLRNWTAHPFFRRNHLGSASSCSGGPEPTL